MSAYDAGSLGVWSPPREMLEEDYKTSLRGGLIPSAEDDVEEWRRIFAEFQFALQPREEWEVLSYELRLLELQKEDGSDSETKSHTELSRELRAAAEQLKLLVAEVGRFTCETPVSVACIVQKIRLGESLGPMTQERIALLAIAKHLEDSPQRPRWRGSAMRRARIILAIKVAPLFERFFGGSARPNGGSETREMVDHNDWTRFYQAIAYAFYGERVTPDRQRVLWDAAGYLRG